MAQSAGFAAMIGLEQLAFTEHSGQLYFDSPTYWSGMIGESGIDGRTGRAERMGRLLASRRRASQRLRVGRARGRR